MTPATGASGMADGETGAGGAMDAGSDLDALVATRVLGHAVTWERTALLNRAPRYVPDGQRGTAPLPMYSHDIDAAWTVVEAMARRGFTFDVEWKGADREYAFTAEGSFRRSIVTAGHAVADTVPLVICRAALSALASAPTGSEP